MFRELHIQKLSRVYSKWLYVKRQEKQQCSCPPKNMLELPLCLSASALLEMVIGHWDLDSDGSVCVG